MIKNMQNMRTTFMTMMMLMASTVSCSANTEQGYNVIGDEELAPNTSSDFEIMKTKEVPSSFFNKASKQGTVELLEYTSKDYTKASKPTTHKPAYVYLPYGYDANQQYNIIYLIHGWGGRAEQYFAIDDWPQMKNLFDNMIEQGLCKPFIAVSPTWDKDNRSKGWGESCQEAEVFSQEYLNDLIPAVEGHYSTYAKTTDLQGILSSRDHRAIGGFSLGSITTWFIFEQAFPYQRYFLPMSGDNWHVEMFGGQTKPKETAEFLASLVNASPYKGDGFYVWYAVGDEDVRFYQTHNQALAMATIPEIFNEKNFSYHQKPGGHHDFNAVWEFCYHAIPFFFPKK